MHQKEHSKQLGAITTTTVRLTESYHDTGKIETAKSRLGSVKVTMKLLKRGLYRIMIVKQTHNDF